MNAQKRAESYAQTLSTLIQQPTVSVSGQTDISQFLAFHQVLRQAFPHVFNTCVTEEFAGSLLVRWPGRDALALPVLFMNHHDVVEPNGRWSAHEPFGGEIADGKVWGRGTLDTKSGLFGMLQAAEELIAEGFTPACDIYFESSCDEEADGEGCLAIVQELERRGIRFSFCLDEGGYIVDNPLGSMAPGTFAMVGVGEKPYVSLRFTAKDEGGHASSPGKNTGLVRLGKFMAAVEKNQRSLFPIELSPAVAHMLRCVAVRAKGPVKSVLLNPEKHEALLKKVLPAVSDTAAALMGTTIAFTMASGSEGINVLPREAWVIANMRCSHHQGIEASVKAVSALAAKYKLEVEVVEQGIDTRLSDFDTPAFSLLEEAILSQYPDVVVSPYIMTGASDSRFVESICDNCLRIVPYHISSQQVDSIHSVDEYIDVATLVPGVDTYKYLMQRVS